MPPKKPKPKSKKVAQKGVADAEQNDADTVDMRQLWLATDALAKAKAQRNYFQLERDKINAFWEITKREVDATKAELRNKERENAEMMERHQVELKVYKQKMRHVLYEQKVQIAAMKMEAERTLKAKQEDHRSTEHELRSDCRDLKAGKKEQQLSHRSMKSTLLAAHHKELSDLLAVHERRMKETHLKYDRRIKALREDSERQRKEDIAAIERRKEEHIAELHELHEKAFTEIRDYYTEITSSNLETIKTLKEEVYSRKKTEASNEKAMFEIAQTNKRLTEPLTKAQKQKRQLQAELLLYSRDQKQLAAAKQELRALEQRHKALAWEHEVLGQRFQQLEEDRDLIFSQYGSMLQDVQRKAAFKRVLLNRKLEVIQSQLERKDGQLSEVIKQANVDAATSATVGRRLEELLVGKNKAIEDLQQLLAAITMRHDSVAQAYETYVRQNGVFGLQTS